MGARNNFVANQIFVESARERARVKGSYCVVVGWGVRVEVPHFAHYYTIIVSRGFNRNYVDVIPDICFLLVSTSLRLFSNSPAKMQVFCEVGLQSGNERRFYTVKKDLLGFC